MSSGTFWSWDSRAPFVARDVLMRQATAAESTGASGERRALHDSGSHSPNCSVAHFSLLLVPIPVQLDCAFVQPVHTQQLWYQTPQTPISDVFLFSRELGSLLWMDKTR